MAFTAPAAAAAPAKKVPANSNKKHEFKTNDHVVYPTHGVGKVSGIELEYTALRDGKLAATGETMTIPADQVFKAIGQTFDPAALNGSGAAIALEGGRIAVDVEGRTSLPNVWAGGDCVFGGDDLTVSAVAQGRDAAESIHRTLMG